MTDQKHKPESPEIIPFQPNEETRRQIDDLMKWWGENQTQVIARAIKVAWLREQYKI